MYRKRRYIRKRRIYRRKRYIGSRIPRKRMSNSIHSFKQTCELSNVSVTAGSTAFFIYNFKITDLSQASSFSQLYDQYRLLAVKLTFYPAVYDYVPTATGQFSAPEIYTALDFDSITLPTTVNTIDQYKTCKHSYFNRPHTRYFKPQAVALTSDQQLGSTGLYNVSRKSWLSWSVGTTPYYGLIGCITASNATALATQLVRVTATYYFQCRNVK